MGNAESVSRPGLVELLQLNSIQFLDHQKNNNNNLRQNASICELFPFNFQRKYSKLAVNPLNLACFTVQAFSWLGSVNSWIRLL